MIGIARAFDAPIPLEPIGFRRAPQVFTASENNGVWGAAIQVPGLAALDKGGADTRFPAVSCAPAGTCAAGGYYLTAPPAVRHGRRRREPRPAS